ncbi:hypothetical protein [Mycobacterium sp. MAA66]|uniref:hypothetical protein n=1 Tax=Mycobacterium sp. MAA66 TaxID=3156297 RepID=UPI003516442F
MKPYAKASVALVGASVITVSAVAPQPSVHLSALSAAPTMAVEVALRDLVNPFAALGEVLQTTIQNVDQLGSTILANPAPILGGVLTGTAYTARDTLGFLNANLHTALTGGLGTVVSGAVSHTGAALGVLGSSAVQAVPGALVSTVQLLNTLGGLGAGVVSALLTTTPADLSSAVQSIRQGDLGDALQSVIVALLMDPLLGPNGSNANLLNTQLSLAAGPFTTVAKILQAGGLNALAAPFSTMANFLENGAPSIVSTAILGGVGVLAGLAYSVGDGLQKMANGVASLNLGKIYNGVVNGLAEIGTAVSNALLSPNPNVGIPGFLLNVRNAIAAWLPKTSPYATTKALSAAKSSAAAIPSTTDSGVTITPTSATNTSIASNTSTTSTKSTTATKSTTEQSGTTPDTATGDATKSSGTSSGSDKASGAASGSDKSSGTASGSDKSGSAASGSDKSSGTASGSDKSSGTSSGSDKSSGTASGSDKSSGATSGSDKSGSAKSATGKSGSGHGGHDGHSSSSGHGGK